MTKVDCSVNPVKVACGDFDECKGCGRCFYDRYGRLGGTEQCAMLLEELEKEMAELRMPGLPYIQTWEILSGDRLNGAFPTPDGQGGHFLAKDRMYLHALVPCEFGEGRCYRVAADMGMILIETCEADGTWPELMIYKKR